MHLKKLELSGFKSFARTTVLEFPSRITAIVGPNGSGKSNVAEAIRWALGEQSMKSLRGKKGEDLIWSGSPPSSSSGGSSAPRMGKASVSLFLDNANGRIPVEFEEVILGRKIFRDGTNEYSLNNSAVRLKDIAELIARLGLGETKHNIIGQGEVDRTLLANARERRALLEEALGLHVYRLKKEEAERKLEATRRNMEQAEALAREIAPHLKFLRQQAKRAESRKELEEELRRMLQTYLGLEGEAVAAERRRIEAGCRPIGEKRDSLRREVGSLKEKIKSAEGLFMAGKADPEASGYRALEKQRLGLERELGRLEGRLEAARARPPAAAPPDVNISAAVEEARGIIAEIKSLIEMEEEMETARPHLLVLVEDLERAIGELLPQSGTTASKEVEELEREVKTVRDKLQEVSAELAVLEKERQAAEKSFAASRRELHQLDADLRLVEEEERNAALDLERLGLEEERLRSREQELAEETRQARMHFGELELGGLSPVYKGMGTEELRRKIERQRLKLEEVGGIDPTVMKEYEETEARHSFLEKELEDLKGAEKSLKELVKELDSRIKKDFKDGFAKIKDEFHNYFRIIFGGGSARLRITKFTSTPKVGVAAGELRIKEVEEGKIEDEEGEEGVEIEVDLPRKRIHGLAMLSGGERALTAAALLFAITAVNPPPFLVLDETDAALDEANSRRYAAILKELAKKTQLVLITHNRETMKAAGILYGVTMGDDGVSRLLSLKLEEAEEYTSR